jgi:hypothetical protein
MIKLNSFYIHDNTGHIVYFKSLNKDSYLFYSSYNKDYKGIIRHKEIINKHNFTYIETKKNIASRSFVRYVNKYYPEVLV